MSRSLARFTPSRLYLLLTVAAVCGTLFSAWMGLRWAPSWIAAALFAVSGVVVGFLAARPVVEIHDSHLMIGTVAIPWLDIQSVDQTGWNSPLAVFLTLRGGHRILVFYAGGHESCHSLLRHLQRFSRAALVDGVSYREFWGEPPAVAPKPAENAAGFPQESGKRLHAAGTGAPARYPLLCPDDEEEVERMFQRLKTVGHLESQDSEKK